VLAAIERRAGAEVTVECNPEDVDTVRLAAYRAAGVTRISVGIQSTSEHVLRDLGRRHGTGALESVATAVHDVGFESWNADLIIGAVAEHDDDLARTLDDVLGLDHPPPHVSAYALTPEPGTPLGQDPRRHPDDDVVARRYELVDARLGDEGYRWEEISNWSLPGHEARHNQLYWHHGEYAGIGCAAHSHLSGVRSWNVRTPERYVAMLARGDDPTAGSERLDGEALAFEVLSLRLRTSAGVPADAFADLDALGDLVERRGDLVVLTRRGRLLANQVALALRSGTQLVDR
jgi:oxygen-independent coproporphyrinogen-3 oxidase